MNQKLEYEKWEDIYNEQNPQQAYSKFYDILYSAFDNSIPIKNQSSKDYKASQVPWVTREILASRKVKNKLYKRFIKNPTETNEKNYKVYRNKFNKIKRNAKKMYYSNKLNELKGNLRHTWKLINEIINKTKSRSELPSNFLKEDNLISDPLEIANYFNEYFVNIGPNLA